jgi:perosamine synthetase
VKQPEMYLPAWQGFTIREMYGHAASGTEWFPFNAPHRTYFHTARSAIYHLFRKLVAEGLTTVLAPDYHMGNELRAIRAAGARVVLYPVGRDWQPDLAALKRLAADGADVVFTIHYGGWPQPVKALRQLCDDSGMLLVEDCALALLSEVDGQSVGSFGDYAVFCLYKTLPTIDGGMLVQNRHVFHDLETLPLKPAGRVFDIGQGANLWIERFRSAHPRPGQFLWAAKRGVGAALTALRVPRVPVGDIGFDPAMTVVAMSSLSRHMLTRLDYDAIRNRRRRNFQQLAARLKGTCAAVRWGVEPGVCPLFFPLLVENKSAAALALWQKGVMATELWNEGDPAFRGQEGSGARFLRRHVLELPIHQDITEAQIEYMARQLTSGFIVPGAAEAEALPMEALLQ